MPSPEVSSDEEEQFLTANESFASGGRVGVGNGSTSGMGYLHNMNQSSGPCEVCGKLLPIKDLLKHEVCTLLAIGCMFSYCREVNVIVLVSQ